MEEPASEDSRQFAYYYPEPYWLAQEGSWIKSLLLFFDGVAILLPSYMRGREFVADPTLAGPLTDHGLLKVLEPDWFVDDVLAERLASGIVELMSNGAFDNANGKASFAALSMSRMAAQASGDHGVFGMILEELKGRGLARDTEDGVSIPLRQDVRLAYLLLLAQEARAAGRRHGFDLQPATNAPGEAVAQSLFELPGMPSEHDVVSFDLLSASVDLSMVPLDEVLSFRSQHGAEHRRYVLNLRQFVAEISTADPRERHLLLQQRQADLAEEAESLRRLSLNAFKKPANLFGFALALTGAAWSLKTGDPVAAGLTALGATVPLIPGRNTGSAYSYIFQAHRQWP